MFEGQANAQRGCLLQSEVRREVDELLSGEDARRPTLSCGLVFHSVQVYSQRHTQHVQHEDQPASRPKKDAGDSDGINSQQTYKDCYVRGERESERVRNVLLLEARHVERESDGVEEGAAGAVLLATGGAARVESSPSSLWRMILPNLASFVSSAASSWCRRTLTAVPVSLLYHSPYVTYYCHLLIYSSTHLLIYSSI